MAETSTKTRCGHCRKEIFEARNGEWYHVRNASTSCYFGTGSDRRAFPAGQPRQSSDTYREHD